MVEKEVSICVECENYIKSSRSLDIKYFCKMVIDLKFITGVGNKTIVTFTPCVNKNRYGTCSDYKRVGDGL